MATELAQSVTSAVTPKCGMCKRVLGIRLCFLCDSERYRCEDCCFNANSACSEIPAGRTSTCAAVALSLFPRCKVKSRRMRSGYSNNQNEFMQSTVPWQSEDEVNANDIGEKEEFYPEFPKNMDREEDRDKSKRKRSRGNGRVRKVNERDRRKKRKHVRDQYDARRVINDYLDALYDSCDHDSDYSYR